MSTLLRIQIIVVHVLPSRAQESRQPVVPDRVRTSSPIQAIAELVINLSVFNPDHSARFPLTDLHSVKEQQPAVQAPAQI